MSKKLKTQLLMLRRIVPKRSTKRQLYRDVVATRKAYKRVWFWTLYVSDENTHMLRKHLFKKDRYMSALEWHEWFSRNLDYIQTAFILPGLSRRTDLSKQWAVWRYIGWIGDAKFASRHAAQRGRRHKTKSQRIKSG